jgi:hypothetical protein
VPLTKEKLPLPLSEVVASVVQLLRKEMVPGAVARKAPLVLVPWAWRDKVPERDSM